MQLFLSYSTLDRPTVDELANILRQGGQEVWMNDAIPTGQQWEVALRHAITQADAIVLALTPNWLASAWCQWEFITAAELGKKVIPVLLAETDVPQRIAQYQLANFIDGLNDAEKVQRFLDDLLILATEVEISSLADTSRTELERQINQAIELDTVSSSLVDIRQKSEQKELADQAIKINGV